VWARAQTVCVLPRAEDLERLLAVVADRNRPLKHVQRARIVLYSADRLPVRGVARRASVSRPAVWRWQARYAEQGAGVLRGGQIVEHYFTPTSASWLNAVKGFISAITRRPIRRGAFHSVDDLQNAITRYINAHNSDCRPFTWATSAKAIFEKVAPIPVSSA
jgi:Homeodomain-like domain